MKPDTATAAILLSNCFAAVSSSPEAWRAFEHEQERKQDGQLESFEDWAMRRAGVMAKRIWERSVKVSGGAK